MKAVLSSDGWICSLLASPSSVRQEPRVAFHRPDVWWFRDVSVFRWEPSWHDICQRRAQGVRWVFIVHSINICCKMWFWALGLTELKILRNTASSSTECVVFSAGAPSFEWNPVKPKLLGAKNGHVVIECKPRAAPRPSISWSKGTELLHNSSRSELTQRSPHGSLISPEPFKISLSFMIAGSSFGQTGV